MFSVVVSLCNIYLNGHSLVHFLADTDVSVVDSSSAAVRYDDHLRRYGRTVNLQVQSVVYAIIQINEIIIMLIIIVIIIVKLYEG